MPHKRTETLPPSSCTNGEDAFDATGWLWSSRLRRISLSAGKTRSPLHIAAPKHLSKVCGRSQVHKTQSLSPWPSPYVCEALWAGRETACHISSALTAYWLARH